MSDRDYQETRTVELPQSVVEEMERRLTQTQFQSVDEYATAALGLLLRELGHDGDSPETDPVGESGDADIENEDAVRDQLKSLGYL